MYTISKEGEWHFLVKGKKPLLTPMGRPVKTVFKPLAEKLQKDLNMYGEDPTDPVSIVTFHYATIDFFSVMPREELEYSVAIGLDLQNDWTFNCPTATPEPMMNWMALFGTHSTNADRGKEWLSSLSLIQLCVVCVIGRSLESVNIPFIVATKLNSRDLKPFAKEVDAHYPYVGISGLTTSLENYLFYFNIEGSVS